MLRKKEAPALQKLLILTTALLVVFGLIITTETTPHTAEASPRLQGPPPLVINEIIQNPAAVSDTNGEWIEIYNPTGGAVDIDGWTIADDDFDSHTINNGGPLLVPANGLIVLGRNSDFATNGGVTVAYQYSGYFLGNGSDEVVLLDGGGIEVDRVNYDNGATFPDPNGASMSLQSPALDNNVGANWCTASTPFGDGDLGTPGAANDCPPPALVINEIIQNPAAVSDTNGEWIEIHNPTSGAVDIDGWTIADNDFDSHLITNGGPLIIPANGFVVLGRNSDFATNGGVTVAYQYSGFFLGNGSDEVVLFDTGLTEVDRVEYDNGATFPDPNGASMSLQDPAVDNNLGANWCTASTPFGDGDLGTPGAANDCAPATNVFIHEIQGSGSSVTNPGAAVTVQGIVVGDYQENPELDGFFMQEETTDEDALVATSEGIFVYCGNNCPTNYVDVNEGDLVTVTGVQEEFFGMSQLDVPQAGGSITIDTPGAGLGLVTPATLDLPVPAGFVNIDDYYEQFEGMLVTFADVMTVTEHFQLARYGQFLISEGGTLRQYTQDATLPINPTDFAAHQDDAARRSIFLDDLDNTQNTGLVNNTPVYHPQPNGFSTTTYVRAGATINSLTGVLHWSWAGFGGTDAWRIRPQISNPVSFNNPARPGVPAVAGNITVASFNVLNYFNGDGAGGGFPTPRGAHSPAELVRQTDKLVAAIVALDADVVGLMEIENDDDGATSAVDDLVEALNASAGAGTYAYVMTGMDATDAIKVALIYQPGVVTPVGAPQVLEDPGFLDPFGTSPFNQYNRPALAQTFQVTDVASTDFGEAFTVVVVHLKSKGSGCGAPDDDPIQGNCNGTREAAATYLANWLATDPTDTLSNLGAVDTDILVIGDFNAYYQEDPMQAFYSAGYTNPVAQSGYTYVFSGQWGSLDHGVASPSITPQVVGADVWHINADENSLLDYNDTIVDSGEASFEQKPIANPGLYNPDEFRASDHDPVVIGLNLTSTPIVIATTPLDGATNVWPATDITVTFNVPVNATTASFIIDCTVSGNDFAYTLSGGPVTYTLDPVVNFVLDETCTVTVVATEVATPDGINMLADYVFSFSTTPTPGPGPSITDPALSKIGVLQPGQLGLPGEQLTWIVTVSNTTSQTLTNIVVTDVIQPELRIDNATTTVGTVNVSGQTVTILIPSLAPGQNAEIRIITTVLSNPAALAFENTATLTADGGIFVQASAQVAAVSGLPDTGYPPVEIPQENSSALPWIALIAALAIGFMTGGWYLQRQRTSA